MLATPLPGRLPVSRDESKPGSGQWCLIEIPGKPPRADILTPAKRAQISRKRGALITPLDEDPIIVKGDVSLIAYPLGSTGFHKVRTDFFTGAARELLPGEASEEEIPAGDVLPVTGSYTAIRHIFYIRRGRSTLNNPGGLKLELIKSGHAEILSLEDRFSVDNERTLKRSPLGLGYLARNHRDNGQTLDCIIGHQDLFKTHGQSLWHEDGRYGLDVEKKHLSIMGDYLRTLAKQCINMRMRIDGLGPIRISTEVNPVSDSAYTVVFVGTSGSFETATGKPRPDIYSDVRGKPGLAIFGISDIPGISMKRAYAELFKLTDCCPGDSGICAAPVGVLILTPISTLNRAYRVITYTYGKTDTGKTSFEKLLLATQSPYARGYNSVPVTISARPARKGGSTTNGNLMHLQYAGGFRALVDDFTTAGMGPQSLQERGEGLSILVGSLEGQPPAKQTWNRSGPDFAQTFSPQASFAINGEILCSDEESVINRIIELHAPDEDFKDPGGYDSELMLSLDTAESGDLRHVALCDLTRYTLAHPEEVSNAYDYATEITAGWGDVGSERMRARSAIALAGLKIAVDRALKHGLDERPRLAAYIRALHDTALVQYERITGAANKPETLRRAIREALADEDISFTGPPKYDSDGREVASWTEPRFIESDDEEENPNAILPECLSSWEQLGLRLHKDTGWSPGKCIAGYFIMPKPGGRPATFPYRVRVPTTDVLGKLARALDKRDGKSGFYTEKTVRDILLSSVDIARKTRAGERNQHVIEINADWLFASEEESED